MTGLTMKKKTLEMKMKMMRQQEILRSRRRGHQQTGYRRRLIWTLYSLAMLVRTTLFFSICSVLYRRSSTGFLCLRLTTWFVVQLQSSAEHHLQRGTGSSKTVVTFQGIWNIVASALKTGFWRCYSYWLCFRMQQKWSACERTFQIHTPAPIIFHLWNVTKRC